MFAPDIGCFTDSIPAVLDNRHSRQLAGMYASPHTALAHWANGIPVAHAQRLFDLTADLYLLMPPVPATPAERRKLRALEALLDYFGHRAITHRPSRADYERELTHIYAGEFAFLRRYGHRPSIAWTGVGRSCSSVHVFLDEAHEMYAVNGDACVIGSATDQTPEPWSVGIYERTTSHAVAYGQSEAFPEAYHAARQSLARGDYRD